MRGNFVTNSEFETWDWVTHDNIDCVIEDKKPWQSQFWVRKVGGSQLFLVNAARCTNYFVEDTEYHYDSVLLVEPDTLVMVYTRIEIKPPYSPIYTWRSAVFKHYTNDDRSDAAVMLENLRWIDTSTSPKWMRYPTQEEELEYMLMIMKR